MEGKAFPGGFFCQKAKRSEKRLFWDLIKEINYGIRDPFDSAYFKHE
jgi:hypothetical protein